MGVLLGVVALTVAADLLSKQVVVSRLVEGRRYALAPGVGICRLQNERGSISGLSLPSAVVLWCTIVGSVGLALLAAPEQVPTVTAAGLGLSVGGMTGNLLDRLLRGSVVDFVVAGRWRVFNLADAAIVVGLTAALAGLA